MQKKKHSRILCFIKFTFAKKKFYFCKKKHFKKICLNGKLVLVCEVAGTRSLFIYLFFLSAKAKMFCLFVACAVCQPTPKISRIFFSSSSSSSSPFPVKREREKMRNFPRNFSFCLFLFGMWRKKKKRPSSSQTLFFLPLPL